MKMKRRYFLKSLALTSSALYLQNTGDSYASTGKNEVKAFHLSVSSGILDDYPELFGLILSSRVTDIWLTGFINGYWYYPEERIAFWRDRFLKKGIAAHIIHVPLGHPFDLSASSKQGALGIEGEIPNITPKHWKKRINADGSAYSGVSVHPPVTEENISAIKRAKALGFKKVFFDDDFRLSVYPGVIGGCFCPEHKKGFLNKYGYRENSWYDLLEAIRRRDHTETLHSWINYTCDELSSAYRSLQQADPDLQTGVMVMYLGAEKSGIRLADYKGSPMRVGELMFDDRMFGTVKGKTDELFSSLFHRRYVTPELAFSETTAFPPEKLSAKNLAAKLNVSLLSDVRNTMFMSGLTPYPLHYWSTLTPAMEKNARLHALVAGQTPRGPLKHYWGTASRYVGDDKPFSLFLAIGIPFEVTSILHTEGWTFLAGHDAKAVSTGQLKAGRSKIIHAVRELKNENNFMYLPETPEDLFRFKRKIIPELENVPYVEEDLPVVCAWYPAINTVLLWNLSEESLSLTVKFKDKQYRTQAEGLNTKLIQL
jgi:hypothetical protein